MVKVNSLNRARRYFRNNNGGPIICIIGGKIQKIVQSLDEAEEFFKFVKIDAEKLVRQMEGLEENNKKDEALIKKYQRILLIPEDQIRAQTQLPNATHEKFREFIKTYQDSIESRQLNIQNIIKNNPEVEPLWIMKKICE